MAYYLYMDGVRYPITPSNIQTSIKGNNKTFNLINEGEVNRIKESRLTEFSFELLLPETTRYPFATYQNNIFRRGSWYLEKIEALKKKSKPFKFKVTRYDPKKKHLFDTSVYVTLEDYTIEEDAENGLDLKVSITLKQWRDYGTKKLVVKKKTAKKTIVKKKTTKAKPKTKKRSKTTTYTVKKGDCLWNIAKKKYGKAERWKEIYKANKDTIEKAARKHGRKSSSNGWWIFPGTKLTLKVE